MTGIAPAIGIVADDITGGAAIGAEIASMGHAVDVVRLSPASQRPTPPHTVIVETGSRYLPPDESARRVQEAVAEMRRDGLPVLMKKIDSTLKGNVATELAAFADSRPGPLLIAPACPEVGLALVGGRQITRRGPGADVADLLAASLSGRIHILDLETVRRGRDAVAGWLRQHAGSTVLADSETQADLDEAAAGAAAAGVLSYAGTYGLGRALAAAFLEPGAAAAQFSPPPVDRVLVLAGSASDVTARQIRELVLAGAEEIVVDIEAVLQGQIKPEARRAGLLASASEAKVIVVHTAPGLTQERVRRHCGQHGWTERDLALSLALPFAEAARAAEGAAVYFIGGETTGAIAELLGLQALTVHGECTPAVPWATTSTPSPWPVLLTKPGAFGTDRALAEAADLLLRHHPGQRRGPVHAGHISPLPG
ncbi:four-carbon acid sugar kinase family protein [Sinomonas notoginsengisoli]|uniref:four-carbon acid sugar kinase family protein n=1 Tax=Sinomonas notoginsengisoli TaxID=1457311 RepID=UPI001F2C4525|nr:four-carbon acid sugar kinase family protein [Sinomonas notoginsengisoli]